MSGVAPLDTGLFRCPECAWRSHERSLRKPPPRFRWALAGLIALAGGTSLVSRCGVSRAGLVELVPNGALIRWVVSQENGAGSSGPAIIELCRRIDVGALSDSQWRTLLQGVLAPRLPSRAVRDHPLIVRYVRLPDWLAQSSSFACEVRTPGHEAPPIPSEPEPASRHALPVTDGEVSLRVDAVYLQEAGGKVQPRSQSALLSFPIEVLDHAERVIQPVSGPDVDSAAQASLRVDIVRLPAPNSGLLYAAMVCMLPDGDSRTRELALGVEITILNEEAEVATLELCPYGAHHPSGTPMPDIAPFGPIATDLTTLPQSELNRWTVRVRGSPAASLMDPHRSRYWKGEYRLPLAAALRAPH